MANHLTPTELADEVNMKRREVISKCMEMGVPIFQGRIDKSLFVTSLATVDRKHEAHPRSRLDRFFLTYRLKAWNPPRLPLPPPASARRRSPTSSPKSVAKYGSKRAVMFKDDSGRWVSRSYDEVGDIVKKLSLGLMALGIEKGDKVSILGNTRPEWTYFDFAALTAGATVVPIYQTNSPEECEYVLENSDASAVIVEDEEQLEKIRAVRDRCPKLQHVIRMTGKGGRRDLRSTS